MELIDFLSFDNIESSKQTLKYNSCEISKMNIDKIKGAWKGKIKESSVDYVNNMRKGWSERTKRLGLQKQSQTLPPKYTFFIFSFLSILLSPERAIIPSSNKYVLSAISIAFLAFCSTINMEIPSSLRD